MSNEKREAAEEVKKHLRTAEKYLQSAEEHVGGTGDKSLADKVRKHRQDVSTTHQELEKKLDPKQGG